MTKMFSRKLIVCICLGFLVFLKPGLLTQYRVNGKAYIAVKSVKIVEGGVVCFLDSGYTPQTHNFDVFIPLHYILCVQKDTVRKADINAE